MSRGRQLHSLGQAVRVATSEVRQHSYLAADRETFTSLVVVPAPACFSLRVRSRRTGDQMRPVALLRRHLPVKPCDYPIESDATARVQTTRTLSERYLNGVER